jgi:hypothetical protein
LKKTALFAIFIFLVLHNAVTQEENKNGINVSANYLFSNMGISIKFLDVGSIITWRDIYLQGAQISAGFGRNTISASFSFSGKGYHVDDDANNDIARISVADTKTTMLEVFWENSFLENGFWEKPLDENRFVLGIGADFNWISLKNYDSRHFPDGEKEYKFFPRISGPVNTYDIYKLGGYFFVNTGFNNKGFYADLSGHLGVGIFFNPANWILRDDFKHPISFADFGMTLKGGANAEAGFVVKRLAFFAALDFSYEISPALNIHTQYHSDGKTAVQAVVFNIYQASLRAGLRYSF